MNLPSTPALPQGVERGADPARGPLHGERLNAATHLAALILSLVFGASLTARAVASGDPGKAIGAAVFSAAAVLLFAASVLCHATTGRRQLWWQRADHAAIFVLIAGTATPFALTGPIGAWQMALFAALWLLAAWGVATEIFGRNAKGPNLIRYVLMGWLGVAAAVPVAAAHSSLTLAWLVAGGAFYSVGTVYFRNPRGLAHAHAIWHLFVLAGTASHFCAVSNLLT